MHLKPFYYFMFKMFQAEVYAPQTPLAIYFTLKKISSSWPTLSKYLLTS